jgi:hypothetical protein
MFDNIKISTRLLKIPISVTGVLYVIIGFFSVVSLLKNTGESRHLISSLSTIIVLLLLAFVHFKAFSAVKSMDEVWVRSSSWSILPNILSTAFLVLFVFVCLFVVVNSLALVVFLLGCILYIFLIIATLGMVFTKEWFGFKYFTHYATSFWKMEHSGLSYLLPDGHDQTLAIILTISLVVFIIPTLLAVFVLAFKHLVVSDTHFEV